MKVTKIVLGPRETNCYVVLEEQSGLGAVIDPALCTDELIAAIENSGMTKLQFIILTHGHSDHILGVYDLKQKYTDAVVVIGDDDEICLMNSNCSLAADQGLEQHPMHADKTVKDGDTFYFGPIEVKAVSTPGHTPGSM